METKTLEKILGEHPFFRGMKAQHLRTIGESATVVRFEPGHVIFEEGEPAHRFYLIRTGRVALQLVSYRIEPFTLMTLEQDDVIGWSWLFPPYRWKFTAKRSVSHEPSPWTGVAFGPDVMKTAILGTNS
jgi:CRP/FNR family cyclic AMP-dependent transcriptional regulator